MVVMDDGDMDNVDDRGDKNDDGVLLVQTSAISLRLIAFQFSNYENIYSRAVLHVLGMMMGLVVMSGTS